MQPMTDFPSFNEPATVKVWAGLLRVTSKTVYRWIASGKVCAQDGPQGRTITFGANEVFLLARLRESAVRPIPAWVPIEIAGFNAWHDVLDELCWLLKVQYSCNDVVRRRKFRLDHLFASYFSSNELTIRKVGVAFDQKSASPLKAVTDDLKRGWYNELAFSTPVRPFTLDLSFAAVESNKAVSCSRFAFPSWRIAQMYYASYFFLRAMTLIKTDRFRLEEHSAAIRAFEHSLQSPLRKCLWKFPFDLRFEPSRDSNGQRRPNRCPRSDYAYTYHPRPPHRSPTNICQHIRRIFKRNATRGKNPVVYGLPDFLRELRVWANYKDIDNLLRLFGPGYKSL
jgi:hypothetical protein